jgi:lysozyme
MSIPKAPPGYLLGVDTGQSQGRVDAAALVAAGVGFQIIRATDGLHDVDPELSYSVAQAKAAGLPFGCYGVLEPYALEQAAAQAAHFVDTVHGLGADLCPCLDFELAHGQTGLVALEAAAAWCDAVEAALGQRVMVYTGPSFIETLEKFADSADSDALAALGQRPLWLAQYTALQARVTVPPPWRDWSVWQSSGDGAATLPGRSIDVDIDIFRGTVDDLRALGSLT